MSSTIFAIPDWTPHGVLPPVGPDPISLDYRSPYQVSLVDFVMRFGNTPVRRNIASGFLSFRAALASVGLVNGFQWIDGSFLEHIEVTEKRAPRDIDVVTFFHLPEGHNQNTLLTRSPLIRKPQDTIIQYNVHAYYVLLDADEVTLLIEQAMYWNNLWSHRRDGRWKGYVQIDLSPTDDATARANLDAKMSGDDT